ncbi:MAG: SPFH domain-containing protein [Deltaproteobacteria bacterium]|nr:SPFH domain-containing protein [Deltaproteobacteria bacterium]
MPNQPSSRFVQRAFIKNVFRRILAALLVVGVVYAVVAIVYASRTLYKVRLNYAVVIERFGGRREPVTEIGWHARLPYFTRIEQEVPLMNQRLFLGGKEEPMRIISKESVALWTSAVLTYRIRDLNAWAILNVHPNDLLQADFDGIARDILQAKEVDQLVSGRELVKEEIFRALKQRPINEGGPTLEKKYGIELVSFVLKETRFGDKLVEATEEKKRRQLIAEAENYAADQEASRIRKLYAAYMESIRSLQKGIGRTDGSTDAALLQFLVQEKWAGAYEKNQTGQDTVVIQNTQAGQNPSVVLPPKAPKGQ